MDAHDLQALYERLVEAAREMIASLPMESASVRERRDLIDAVSGDNYWLRIDPAKARVLNLEIAPLMRYLAGVDLAAATFEIHCLEAIRARLDDDHVSAERATRAMREDIIRLPVQHPEVAGLAAEIRSRYSETWCTTATVEELLKVREQFKGVMRFRQAEPDVLITLDLADVLQEQKWIEVGPTATRYAISDYQSAVIARVTDLASHDRVFQSVAAGELPDAANLAALHSALSAPDLFADEPTLQRAWRAPHASALAIVRDILGVEPIVARDEAIQQVTTSFTATKNFLQQDQLTLVKLIARRVIDAGYIDPGDLLEPPFTSITHDAEGLLGASNLAELLGLLSRFEVR